MNDDEGQDGKGIGGKGKLGEMYSELSGEELDKALSEEGLHKFRDFKRLENAADALKNYDEPKRYNGLRIGFASSFFTVASILLVSYLANISSYTESITVSSRSMREIEVYKKNPSEKHALIISGEEERHLESSEEIYRTLKGENFGNIYVLTAEGKDYGGMESDGRVTEKNVENIFEKKRSESDRDDFFALFANSHGDKRGTYPDSLDPLTKLESFIAINGENRISASAIEEGCELLECPKFISISACHGGGIAEEVAEYKTISAASTGSETKSYTINGNTFNKYLAQSISEGKGDLDGNGKISIEESFKYAGDQDFAVRSLFLHLRGKGQNPELLSSYYNPDKVYWTRVDKE